MTVSSFENRGVFQLVWKPQGSHDDVLCRNPHEVGIMKSDGEVLLEKRIRPCMLKTSHSFFRRFNIGKKRDSRKSWDRILKTSDPNSSETGFSLANFA